LLDESGSLLRCARHGALFLMDSGACVVGPCAGRSLSRLTCEEDKGGVWLVDGPDG
jgi:nitrite reductase/ring-hydroxylating ferredoxin subunit